MRGWTRARLALIFMTVFGDKEAYFKIYEKIIVGVFVLLMVMGNTIHIFKKRQLSI